MGGDEEAQVLWFRVAPKVAEVCHTPVGNHPNQEYPEKRLEEETVAVVDNENDICADVVLYMVEGKDKEAFKEEEEQDGDKNFGELVECEDVATIVPDSVQAWTKLPDPHDHVAVEDAEDDCARQHDQPRLDVNVRALP